MLQVSMSSVDGAPTRDSVFFTSHKREKPNTVHLKGHCRDILVSLQKKELKKLCINVSPQIMV